MTRRILVVDEQPFTARQLEILLGDDDFEVETAAGNRQALELLQADRPQLVVADWRPPDLGALELLTAIRRQRSPVGVLIVSSAADTAMALEAMKAGADDFISRPFEPDRLRCVVRRVLERRALIDELEQLRLRLHSEHGFHDLLSKNAQMRRVFDLIERIGPHNSAVLIHGETGTGKDLVARAIHKVSGRTGPWVALNCAALQESLLESELFGHERGAFTGADRQRAGRFEQADGGTLFLDEVAEISPAVQAKLLRVLQSGQFERVGGMQTLEVDVRILSATNKRLEDEVAAGRFRADLYYRLCVMKLELPPLRQRKEDIPLLAAHFLERLESRSTPPVTQIHPEAMQALLDHSWPGNVRELENAVKAAVAMADGTVILRETLPASVAPRRQRRSAAGSLIDIERPMPEVTAELVAQVEREYFGRLLARYRGNIARCARHSGMSRRCVALKLQKYGLEPEEFRLSLREERRLSGA